MKTNRGKKMKTKKPNTKEQNIKNIRIFSYFLFFYFGIRLLIMPILAFQGEVIELFGYFGIIFNFGLVIFGIYATYQLRKIKKWALVSLIILFAWNTINVLISSTVLGNTKLPAVQIAALLFLIVFYRNLKNSKMI